VFAAILLLAGAAGGAWADAVDDVLAGQAAARRGEHQAAVELLSRAIDSGELEGLQLAPAHFARAGAFDGLNDFALAIDDFGKAIALDPDNTAYRMGRARTHLRANAVFEAMHDLSAVIEQQSPAQAVIARLLRSTAFLRAGQFEEAATDCQAIAAAQPTGGLSALCQGQVHEAQGDTEAAVAAYREAAARNAPGATQRLRALGVTD
jgi:tetratricopeptide (TPR) repeat protein